MFFVQSRIAMNDTYVGGLLLLAYVIFAVMWLNGDRGGRRAWLGFWLGMPLLGLTLGLALAAKWVAMYAIASIGILILARSALGRVIAILALAAGTGILGWHGHRRDALRAGHGRHPGRPGLCSALAAGGRLGGRLPDRSIEPAPRRTMVLRGR